MVELPTTITPFGPVTRPLAALLTMAERLMMTPAADKVPEAPIPLLLFDA
jgi:hypothetical protein